MIREPSYAARAFERLADQLPDLDFELLVLYALLALTRGTDTTLEDVHDAWSLWRMTARPDHRSLVPFAELSPEVQELDRPYMEATHRVAGELAGPPVISP